jgi:hypothetical protein
MKKSVPEFQKYLTVLGETLKYAAASHALRLHPSTIFDWLKSSKAAAAIERPDQPSEFKFEHGGTVAWLHEHVRNVITISIEEIESAARSRALHGTVAVARFQGATVYRRDPALIGRPDIVELCGLPDDLMRDPVTGLPMPELIHTAPSTDLVAMILQAHSKIYRRQSSVSVGMTAKISGGVMVVGGPQQRPQAQLPLPILEIIDAAEEEPTRTEQAIVEDLDTDAYDDFDDAEDDAPVAQLAQSAPVPAPVADGIRPDTIKAKLPTTTARPVQPPPMASGPNPAVNRNTDSALVRDLLSRMRGPAGVRSAPISKAALDEDDYSTDRTGPGETTGTKIL